VGRDPFRRRRERAPTGLPRGQLQVTLNLDAGVLVGSYAEADPPASLAETRRDVALHLGRHTQANRERIDKRLTWFTGALVGFLAEVLGLVMVLLDLGRK